MRYSIVTRIEKTKEKASELSISISPSADDNGGGNVKEKQNFSVEELTNSQNLDESHPWYIIVPK